jgi:hypothetical protein
MKIQKLGNGVTAISGDSPEELLLALALIMGGMDALPVDLSQYLEDSDNVESKQS